MYRTLSVQPVLISSSGGPGQGSSITITITERALLLFVGSSGSSSFTPTIPTTGGLSSGGRWYIELVGGRKTRVQLVMGGQHQGTPHTRASSAGTASQFLYGRGQLQYVFILLNASIGRVAGPGSILGVDNLLSATGLYALDHFQHVLQCAVNATMHATVAKALRFRHQTNDPSMLATMVDNQSVYTRWIGRQTRNRDVVSRGHLLAGKTTSQLGLHLLTLFLKLLELIVALLQADVQLVRRTATPDRSESEE